MSHVTQKSWFINSFFCPVSAVTMLHWPSRFNDWTTGGNTKSLLWHNNAANIAIILWVEQRLWSGWKEEGEQKNNKRLRLSHPRGVFPDKWEINKWPAWKQRGSEEDNASETYDFVQNFIIYTNIKEDMTRAIHYAFFFVKSPNRRVAQNCQTTFFKCKSVLGALNIQVLQ